MRSTIIFECIKIKAKEKQGTPLNTLHFENLITLITVGVCLYQPY